MSERLDFIDNYKAQLKKLERDMDNYLIENKLVNKDKGTLKFINFKDLDYMWGFSDSVQMLFAKVTYMIDKGQIPNIIPMLNGIVNRDKPKKFVKPADSYNKNVKMTSVGRGDFRFNDRTYELTNKEKQKIKEFFKL